MSIFKSDPAAPGANVGRAAATPLNEAVLRFNDGPAPRTVAGLTRSLGRPNVSIGTAAGSPSTVRITVAWELCWYQWGVDLADESREVFPIDRGGEVDELDRSARQWNACCGERGEVELGVPVG